MENNAICKEINDNAKIVDSLRKKHKRNKVLKLIINYFFLSLFSIFFLFPFIVMVCYSILPDKESLLMVLISPSRTINLGTFSTLLSNSKYLLYLKNSLISSLLAAIGIPLSASLCAYGFSKMEFKGKNVLFGIVLSTMMLPGIATQIPLYTVYSKIGWANTLLPLWVPGWFGGGATNIFLMTQFMRGIPKDLCNAAKIDGANSLVIFIKMMIPLCIPVFLFVTVSSFMGSWNDFMTPLLYISNPSKFTLSLGIYRDYGGPVGGKNLPNISNAAGLVMMLPCLLLFFIFQKYLIEGVTVTGLKG